MNPHNTAQEAVLGNYRTNYPTYHFMVDGGCICNLCVEAEAEQILDASANHGTNSQWEYLGTEANYEDTSLYCDHCGKRIASAYCDDEIDDDCVW